METYKIKFFSDNLIHTGTLETSLTAENDIEAEKIFRSKFQEIKPFCITISRKTD